MTDKNDFFPTIKKNIEDLIEDEEGNIPGDKLLVLGTMVIILGSMLSIDSFAGHGSHGSHSEHASHSSHGSHTSHSSGTGSHSNHSSHSNHTSHSNSSHSSHSSASEHISHVSSSVPDSNASSSASSGTESEASVSLDSGTNASSNIPEPSTIPGIAVPATTATEDTFALPDVNTNIEIPNGTPASGIMAPLSVPASSPEAKIDTDAIHKPSQTDEIE